MSAGAPGARLREAWQEIRENPGRTTLQTLGVVLGVASVLGGFSISDSMRREAEQYYTRLGGLDKLHVWPHPVARAGPPTALQAANLGLRERDASGGAALDPGAVSGVSVERQEWARARSPHTSREGQVTGIGADYLALAGYGVAQGRAFSARELETGAPVVLLGTRAARTFFPDGTALGRTLVLGDIPATVVGTLQERVFRIGPEQENLLRWYNDLIAVPSAFVQKRLQADPHRRLDTITFRLPTPGAVQAFSRRLANLIQSQHRGQMDFRLDDLAARVRRLDSQSRIYDVVFLLSGVLALVGGGIVNVNIQMASLKERVREVGVKMALGASEREVFKGFMTEALLLTGLGACAGLAVGTGFSWILTRGLDVSLTLRLDSFVWAFLMAALSGFVFALYPAWKASRLSPMEALRYE